MLLVLCMLLAPPVSSGMTALGDRELATVHAGSGVSLNITGTALINVGSFFYQDTDTRNRIELQNIVNTFSFTTPPGDPLTVNIGTSDAGQTLLNLHDSTGGTTSFSANLHFLEYSLGYSGPNNYDPGYYVPGSSVPDYTTDYIVHDLGSINVGDIVRTQNNWLIGAHGGLSFQNNENLAIGYAQYNYNTTQALAFTGIHFFGTTVVGAPESPSTWTSYPGTFQIGDFAGGNPGRLDIGTDDTGTTTMSFGLPMTGSIRVTDVNFGGNDFGQLALDGINVHRLAIQLHPGP